MKLDYLIAASLTDGFCGQIAFFRRCLDALGTDDDARLVAVFGDPERAGLPDRWRRHFDRIGVEWAYSKPGEEENYQAQHYRRFGLVRPDCDLALICDADVAPLRPIGDMARQLIGQAAIGGVIAHYPPPLTPGVRTDAAVWADLAQSVLGRDIARPYRYTLLPPSDPEAAPFYVNYGMVAAPPDVLAEFHRREQAIRAKVFERVGSWWGPQMALTLACDAMNTVALPMRYNFPNDTTADAMHPQELGQIAFLHYLRLEQVRRDEVFACPRAFDAFVGATHLGGANGVFRRHVLRLTGGEFPFV